MNRNRFLRVLRIVLLACVVFISVTARRRCSYYGLDLYGLGFYDGLYGLYGLYGLASLYSLYGLGGLYGLGTYSNISINTTFGPPPSGTGSATTIPTAAASAA